MHFSSLRGDYTSFGNNDHSVVSLSKNGTAASNMVSSLVRQYYQLNDKHFKFIPHNPDVAPSDNDAFILFSMAMLSEGVGESGSI